jgi:anti-sigma regulatory factor (Ser/Thr protein kinase)
MSPHSLELLRLRLPCDPSAPQDARQALGSLAELELVREDVLLVATELITNAVLHSGCQPAEELEVVAELIPEAVVIAVTDVGRSAGDPSAEVRDVGAGGLGLRLIGSLARCWGTERGSGRRVWAELALAA